MNTCKDCKYFMGMGDWDLCCSKPPARAKDSWCGFLCYEDTGACENFKEKEEAEVMLPEVWNDTELSLDALNQIKWEYVSKEEALGVSAITYINPEDTIVKKVWHDGMTEYYHT